jgi:alkylhydroperoxidase family enzyme
VSSQVSGAAVDLTAVNGAVRTDAGVTHGARLIAFTEAVMGDDDETLARERAALRAVLSAEAFVDVAAVVGAFNVVDRIADATGIPLDPPLAAMSADVQRELDLGRFASAANTPGVR